METPDLERELRALGQGAGILVNGRGFALVAPSGATHQVLNAAPSICEALKSRPPGQAIPPTQVMIPASEIVSILQVWHAEWEKWQAERDATPLNHAHRRIHEGMCNTFMARIADLHDLMKKYGILPRKA